MRKYELSYDRQPYHLKNIKENVKNKYAECFLQKIIQKKSMFLYSNKK